MKVSKANLERYPQFETTKSQNVEICLKIKQGPLEWEENLEYEVSVSGVTWLFLLLPLYVSVYLNNGKRDQLEWVVSSLNESSQISFIKIFPTFQTPDTLKTISNYESN